ncbi:hypothetical protein GCM10007108_14280 [Thermogymnomonas acidicola]|uniref:Uncharacterized protein n=1 Tax=Thermogymnomonas acidicola TaxID=399579 RepID=A0AA37BSG4_9ARCH|nr:hypothetical protein [Thermogymnomonas acidicola]GGM77274.1 hypothetical protein GCM10007108_14280 [Thermogymnomonas acidicola]
MNRYAYPLSFGVAAALTYLFLMSPIWYLTILAGLLSALPLYGKPIPVALCSMAGSAVGLAGYLYPLIQDGLGREMAVVGAIAGISGGVLTALVFVLTMAMAAGGSLIGNYARSFVNF